MKKRIFTITAWLILALIIPVYAAAPLINLATQVKGLLSAANMNLGSGVASNAGALTTVGQQPSEIGSSFIGTPANAQIMLFLPLSTATTVPVNCTSSKMGAKTAATASTTFTLYKLTGSPTASPVAFGTAVFSASGTVAAFTCASPTSFAVGDYLEVDGPALADATLKNIGLGISAIR